MTVSKRRVGIIGIGFGSQVYVPAFASEGWDVVALCSRHADKARTAADAAALAAGKHVLCEKPFALDAAQALSMRDAAQKSGRTAMIGHEFRHAPQRAYIKTLLDERYIGRFELCTIELFLDRYVTPEPRPLTWMARQADGGGVLGALGSHYIDGLRHWFGDVKSVSGRLLALRPDLKDPATGRKLQ